MAEKRHGLLLILGGAPNTPHAIAGLRGLIRPDLPLPVGEPGDAIESLDDAKAFASDHADAVELVEIPAAQVKEALSQSEADLALARNGLVEARKDGRAADDSARFDDERKAVSKEKK